MSKDKLTLLKQRKEVPLDSAGIDALAQLLSDALERAGVHRKDIIRLRLAVEEILGLWRSDAEQETRIVVGMATCGIAAGARPVFNEFVDLVAEKGAHNVKVTRTGCLGMCKLEPIVEVFIPGEEKVTYVKVDPEKAKEIFNRHIIGGQVVTDYVIGEQ